MSDLQAQVEAQSRAYLDVLEADRRLQEARQRLRAAERERRRQTKPYTVLIDGKLVTSHRPIASADYRYAISELLS